ncbi:MAG TPA: hypothetical protein VGG64_25780 [Pirellulales bacterium]|jgi:hypothetical protein
MSDLPDALTHLPTNQLSATQQRELRSVSSRGVRVPYDPARQSAAEAVVRQLGLVGAPANQLQFGLSPETAAALASLVDPARLETLKAQSR